MMHEREKSDPAVVAVKPTNKAERSAAEPVEPRAGAKGNAEQHSTCRAQYRVSVSQALERIRQVRRHSPEVGAVCGKAARTDLCGGRSEMSVPTAIALVYLIAGGAFVAGTLVAYAWYLFVHHCAHHCPDKLPLPLLKHHQSHHRFATRNYGVSTTLWDHVFGTMLG